MDKLDKTKEKIGVSKLNEKSRKELFNKFVDSGGEVLSEKKKKRKKALMREKKAEQKSYPEKKIQRKPAAGHQTVKSKKKVQYQKKQQREDSFFGKLINKFKILLKLRFLKVTQFNGFYFNIKFLERFNNIYKPSLMEIQMVYFDIFKTDLQSGNKIISRLDKEKASFYEAIEMISGIYDNTAATQIVEHYISFPNVPQNILDLKDPLMDILKKLYVLRTHENTILQAFDLAIKLNIKIKNKKSSYYSQQRKKIRNGLSVLFGKLYPRLHWLFCQYEGKFFDLDDAGIESFLGITEMDKPGRRKSALNEIENIEQDIASALEENEDSDEDDFDNNIIEDNIKKGLHLIYALDLQNLKKEFDKNEMFKLISIKDKILVTYLQFNEFDKEYSFILTTNKIKYRVNFNRDGKLDYRTNLQNLYDQMRKCYNLFKDYSDITHSYIKLSKEKPVSNTQYVQYSKRLTDLQNKRTQNAQKTREIIKSFTDKVSAVLKTLLEDINGEQKYIENPDDVLEFIQQIEGNKKINNKKVHEALEVAYNFVSAFSYQLGFGGELSGSLEFKDEDISKRKIVELPENTNAGTKKMNTGGNVKKTILDELDDIL